MKNLKFKCSLLTDVILNVKSASEGANSTLDFIPGNCFLGIVASQLYGSVTNEEAMDLFHNGRVRFGDAHPSKDGMRGQRIPAAFYYAKGDSIYDNCYIYHHIQDAGNIKATNGSKAQLKQSRTGFFIMTEEIGEEVAAEKSFAIKSAYDRDERRSKDAAMFGYESLSKGMKLLFSVEIDDDNLEKAVVDALIGERRVGRSRTAQYGLVEIEQCSFPDTESYHDDELTVIYADSRLIFLDDNGQPTFRPTVEQLLGKGAKGQISWEDCQLRTFQYSPWNYKRQCYDTDRCGIEKGSVFVIRHTGKSYDGYSCVGSYQNEGFGIIVFNPVFMLRGGSNGLSKCKFVKEQTQPTNKQSTSTPTVQSPLFQYLIRQAENERKDKTIYKRVNEWKAASLFIGKEKFASQWGAIRSIALQCKNDDEIAIKVNEFISHGVKAENWYGKRADALREFMEENKGNLWAAIINLASEMAKKCVK